MSWKTLVRNAVLIVVLAAAAAALATAYATKRQTLRAEAAFPPVGDFVTLPEGRVHYVQRGTGPDLVLLHGAGGNLREYTFHLMDLLADRYRVTAFDRPGLGYTDRVPGVATGSFATAGDPPIDQARMLRAAAAELGLRAPVVVGHSFGGIVGLAWANLGLDEDTPVNAAAYVSLAGVAMPWPGDLGWYYTYNGSALGGAVLAPLISAWAPERTIRDAVAETFQPQSPPSGYADHIGAPLTLRIDSFRANVRQVNTLRPHVVEMAKRYPELTLPIEILHGSADTTVPAAIHSEELVRLVPSARLTLLPGIGHMPQQIDPEATVAAIDRAASRAGLR